MTRLDRTAAPHHVYRCYDADGRLLYVGCSANLFGRLAQHRTTSWWSPTVARVKAEVYPNGVAARAAERRAISHEVPRWNKSGKWAGRHLWTESDWNDWLTVLFRGFDRPPAWLPTQVVRSVADRQALFAEPLPEHLARRWAEIQEGSRQRQLDADAKEAARRAAWAAQEAKDQDELSRKRNKKGKAAS